MGLFRAVPLPSSGRPLRKFSAAKRPPLSTSLLWAISLALGLWALTWRPLASREVPYDKHAAGASCQLSHWLQGQCQGASLLGGWRRAPPQAVLLSGGDLGSRLHALCAAEALAAALDLRLQIVWQSDQWLPATRFSELFHNPELGVVEDLEGAHALGEGWRQWRQLADVFVEACQGGQQSNASANEEALPQPPDWDRQLAPPEGLYVSPEFTTCGLRSPAVGPSATCQLATHMRQCYRRLEPAMGVRSVLVGLNWTQIRSSRGVLLQAGDPTEARQGHLAPCLLPPPSAQPGKPDWLQRIIAENEGSGEGLAEALKARLRAGQIPSLKKRKRRPQGAARRRLTQLEEEEEGAGQPGTARQGGGAGAAGSAQKTRGAEEQAEAARPGREGGEDKADPGREGTEEGQRTRLGQEEGGEEEEADRAAGLEGEAAEEEGGEEAGSPPLREERCRGGSGSWRDDANQTLLAMVNGILAEPRLHYFVGGAPLQALHWLQNKIHPDRTPETLGFATEGMQVLCRGSPAPGGGLPTWGPEHVHATGLQRLPLVACARRQLAELLVLAQTRSLLHLFPSGATDFIAARAAGAHSEALPPLCQQPRLPPLRAQRWTQFVDVDERLHLLYCAMPKIACTTFRTWMRRIRGLPELEEPEMVHNRHTNGLTVLYFHYSESQIVRILTNPAMFRFTFVRNPWNRILSGYLDKHVLGGVVERNRHQWNRQFFGRLGPGAIPGPDTDGFISFQDFVVKVGKATEEYRGTMDEHIAPQVDLCAFDTIKYDFVGRFENLVNDTIRLAEELKLSEKGLALPDFGRSAHSTKSEKKLREHYDLETVFQVRKAYHMDMSFPLNDISFRPPLALSSFKRGTRS